MRASDTYLCVCRIPHRISRGRGDVEGKIPVLSLVGAALAPIRRHDGRDCIAVCRRCAGVAAAMIYLRALGARTLHIDRPLGCHRGHCLARVVLEKVVRDHVACSWSLVEDGLVLLAAGQSGLSATSPMRRAELRMYVSQHCLLSK